MNSKASTPESSVTTYSKQISVTIGISPNALFLYYLLRNLFVLLCPLPPPCQPLQSPMPPPITFQVQLAFHLRHYSFINFKETPFFTLTLLTHTHTTWSLTSPNSHTQPNRLFFCQKPAILHQGKSYNCRQTESLLVGAF